MYVTGEPADIDFYGINNLYVESKFLCSKSSDSPCDLNKLPNSIVICFFLHICNFMVTKPNKVNLKK